jgi:hypothetical protein
MMAIDFAEWEEGSAALRRAGWRFDLKSGFFLRGPDDGALLMRQVRGGRNRGVWRVTEYRRVMGYTFGEG